MVEFEIGDKVQHKIDKYKGVVTDLSSHDGDTAKGFIRVKRDDKLDGSPDGSGKWAVQPGKLKFQTNSRKFKTGDRVKVLEDCSGTMVGWTYTLTDGNKSGEQKGKLWASKGKLRFNDSNGCSCKSNWELVKKAPITLLQKVTKNTLRLYG